MTPPEVRVVIERSGSVLMRCAVVDEGAGTQIELPIKGIEYEHGCAGVPGTAKLILNGHRVFFEDV